MTPVAPKLVYRFLRENGLHEVIAIAHDNDWQYLCNYYCHISLQCHWHLKLAPILQHLPVCMRKICQHFLTKCGIGILLTEVTCFLIVFWKLRGILQTLVELLRNSGRWLWLDTFDLLFHIAPPVEK